LGHGLVNGLSGVGISMLGAVGGLAHHPLSAILDTRGVSATGLVGGIARGLVGVVTKPLGGAAELVAQAGNGLLQGAGWTKSRAHAHPPMPDHACTFANANLKYTWKLLAGALGWSTTNEVRCVLLRI
jgi:vacuolar protein sorting-associated protein 13B